MHDFKPMMHNFLTALDYVTCHIPSRLFRHYQKPPPVNVNELEMLHHATATAAAAAAASHRSSAEQNVRSLLGNDAGHITDAFKSLLDEANAAMPAEGASFSTDIQSALLEKFSSKLNTFTSNFHEASHHLLRELFDKEPRVQRPVINMLLENFGERLSPLAHKSAEAILYDAKIHERYHPKAGLPHQYGWDVSPVKHELYDVLLAALQSLNTLHHPLYRMPRLDQFAAELVRQARDPSVSDSGFAIARMASFFHQVGFYFHIEKGEKPTIYIMPVDSEKRGKEIALQLAQSFKGSGCTVIIDAVNAGTQFSPAGCPLFAPVNIGSMNAQPEKLGVLMQKIMERQPLHEEILFSYDADPDISIVVYNGEHFLWSEFYAVCQSTTTLRRIQPRLETTLETRMEDAIDNFGKQRKVNFRLEQTHEERIDVMRNYLKDLLAMPPAQGNAKLKEDILNLRQSSLGDDNDLEKDQPVAAEQLADAIGEAVVWFDISSLMNDNQRWNALLDELDRTDGPQHMKLGYLHKNGFPVFSDWYVKDNELYLKDDRYFHARPDAPERPSDYMRSDIEFRAGATYNFVAFPKSAFESGSPVFAGLAENVAMPRCKPASATVSDRFS